MREAQVTKDMVRDLLPVYLAGEASADTRAVVEAFLAEDRELREIVEEAVRSSGAETAKDMGVAMKHAMAAVDGRADGKRVSGLVRASLQG